MDRDQMLARLRDRREPWDIVVIGGGATGAGIAVDAASRGLGVLLLERADFASGTSSRSTKLIHGGVRYLRQGRVGLVREALHERTRLLRNAPHVVHALPFVVPNHGRMQEWMHRAGLALYDRLAGKHGLGKSRRVPAAEMQERFPTVRHPAIRSGIQYFDAQFDDARLLLHILFTAEQQGACLLNYFPVEGLELDAAGQVRGVRARDRETDQEFTIASRVVVNATGPFSDDVRRLAEGHIQERIVPSQGIHVTLDRDRLPGDDALVVPKTPDGRLMFLIPWAGYVLLGTTDTALPDVPVEPRPMYDEVRLLLETAADYLEPAPTERDVRATFAGIRPLVRRGTNPKKTGSLSRTHLIDLGPTGLVTIAGGKWTTYRRMAEDCVDRAIEVGSLPPRPCVTADLPLARWEDEPPPSAAPLERYRHAIERQMARTIIDVLARRLRILQLDFQAAREQAPRVGEALQSARGLSDAAVAEQMAEFEGLLAALQSWQAAGTS